MPKPEIPESEKPAEYRKLGGLSSIVLGSFLLAEHIYTWGGFDLDDFPFGHEWYGLGLIIFGVLLASRRKGKMIGEGESE